MSETETIRACGRCRFAIKFVPPGQIQSQLQCRRAPPSVIVLPTPGKRPGEVGMTIMAFAPPIPENYWCHEFIPLAEGQTLPTESGNVQNAANGGP